MTLFWILAVVMLVVAVLIMLPALLKVSKEPVIARDLVNTAIFNDQFAELKADLASETLSPEQFEQGRLDLARNLLSDNSGDAPAVRAAVPRMGRNTALVLALTVPALAVGIYLQLGSSTIAFSPEATAAREPEAQEFSPELMVQRLAEHLKTQPEDGAGWELLGRSLRVLGRFPEASTAYANAARLQADNAQVLADYADVLALNTADQSLLGKPTELFERALQIDPKNPKAVWLAGMAAFQRGEFRVATDYWRRLAQLLPADSPDTEGVNEAISEAETRAAAAGGITVP